MSARARAATLALAVCWASVGAHAEEAPKAKPSAPRASSEVDGIVRKLQARYEATADFTADFTQSVEVPTLGKTLESTGQVFFKRPGRMRWEFAEPDRQTIVADGETLWVYQPEHHQVLKAPFRAAFQSATPISFLFGVGELASDFHPSLLPPGGAGTHRLRLVPKQDKEIGVLVLDVDSGSYDIVAAEVNDPLGNVTRLRFANLKRGVGLADSRFTLETPPGTDVVEAPGNP